MRFGSGFGPVFYLPVHGDRDVNRTPEPFAQVQAEAATTWRSRGDHRDEAEQHENATHSATPGIVAQSNEVSAALHLVSASLVRFSTSDLVRGLPRPGILEADDGTAP